MGHKASSLNSVTPSQHLWAWAVINGQNDTIVGATVSSQFWSGWHVWVSTGRLICSEESFCVEVVDFAAHLATFGGALLGDGGWHSVWLCHIVF